MMSLCHAGFVRNSQGCGACLLHLLRVHRLVDHTCQRHVTTHRQPADTILRVANLTLVERKPGVEEEVELLDTHTEDACRDVVAKLVDENQKAENQNGNENSLYYAQIISPVL